MTVQKKSDGVLLLFGNRDDFPAELGPAEGATDAGCSKALVYARERLPEWLRWDQIRDGSGCEDADIHLLISLGLIERDSKGCGFLRISVKGELENIGLRLAKSQ